MGHVVNQVVHAVSNVVQDVIVGPTKQAINDTKNLVTGHGNITDVAGVLGGAAPFQYDAKHPYATLQQAAVVATVFTAGASSGAASAAEGSAASEAPAVAAEGAAPAAASAGGAGAFATPAALTTTTAPDFALAPADYVTAYSAAPSYAFTGGEQSALAAETAGTSTLAPVSASATPQFAFTTPSNYVEVNPAGASEGLSFGPTTPANYVELNPPLTYATAPTSSPGVLSGIENSLSNAVQHPLDTIGTGIKDFATGLGLYATLNRLFSPASPTPSGGGGGAGGFNFHLPGSTAAGPGGAGSNYSAGSGGSSVTNSTSTIGGVPTYVVYALLATAAALILSKKLRF